MDVRLGIADGFLTWDVDAPRTTERRELTPALLEAITTLSVRYRAVLRTPDPQSLLSIGNDLCRWLDGSEGWLARLLSHPTGALSLEISCATDPDAAAWAVLNAPWELLTDSKDFLARDEIRTFAPVRRLGPRGRVPRPEPLRLGVAFMAAVPRGWTELGYDAEELSILQAAGPRLGIDLVVEDSGDPVQLRERLQEVGTLPVAHLSCHGRNGRGPGMDPVLLMEDEGGDERPFKAGELFAALAPHHPRLIFLSACLSAAPGEAKEGGPDDDSSIAHSFATQLIRASVPAVLGWGGSVADVVATSFAKDFYAGLAAGQRPADAAATARRALMATAGTISGPNKDAAFATKIGARKRAKASEWHFARLWLGPDGGGPVAKGTKSRWQQGFGYERKLMMDERDPDSAVCSPEFYVGRRRELQKALQTLRRTEHCGVMIHGLGLQGKSSLAWRIVTRRRDLRFVLVFKKYDVRSIADDLERALATHPAATRMIRAHKDKIRDASGLQSFLVKLLTGPCALAGEGAILLLIDDLEQILEPNPTGGRHVVRLRERDVLTAVFRAFDLARGDSRLLVTSRYSFALPDELERHLVELPLATLSEKAQENLALRRHDAAASTGVLPDDRIARLGAARNTARGHPGLQDLLCDRALSVGFATAFTPLLNEVDAHLAGGPLPVDTELRNLMAKLNLAQPLDAATVADKVLLQAATLFHLPVPSAALEALAAELGGSVNRLIDLGLLQTLEDIVDPTMVALAPSPLIRPRLGDLDEAAQSQFANLAAPALLDAWSGHQNHDRPGPAEHELTRLGMLGHCEAVIVASATKALLEEQRRSGLRDALVWVRRIITWLDQRNASVPWSLLSVTGSLAGSLGEGQAANELIGRAIQAYEQAQAQGDEIDPREAASVQFEWAMRLTAQGRYSDAQIHAERAISLIATTSNARDVAVVRVLLADIMDRLNKPEAALQILRLALDPLKDLGEMHHLAIGLGVMADVHRSLGNLDTAIDIRKTQQIPLLQRLDDKRGLLMARLNLARLLIQKGELDVAERYLIDCYETVRRSGHADATVQLIGDLESIKFRTNRPLDKNDLNYALDLAKSAHMSDGIVSISLILAVDMKRQGQTTDAIEFLHKMAAQARELGMNGASFRLEKFAADWSS